VAERRVFPVYLAFFVMGFVDAVGTLVGFARKEFAISGAAAGLLPFFGFVAFALFSVPSGVLAGRRGKKAVLVLALGVVLLGQLLPTISLSHYTTLLVAIFLIGIGMTALQVAGNPIMRDVSASGLYARNLTFAQFIKSLGSISGPYATTLLIALGFSWTRIFPVFAAATLVALLAVLGLKVTETRSEEPASVKSSFALLSDGWVAALVAGVFLYVGAEVGLNSWLATHLSQTFGMDLASDATRLGPGLFFISLAAGRLLGSFVLGFTTARRFLFVSVAIALAGLAALLLGTRAVAVAGVAATGLGFANIWPLVFSIAVERRPERAGELSGLMCMAIAGGALMPPLMGLIGDASGYRWSLLVPLAAFVYLAFLAAAVRREPAVAAA
jgi:MFS transporter, FHS family, L-fucose permease